MSTFRVDIVDVHAVKDCPNSENLSLISLYGWDVVAKKGTYQKGDLVVFVPPDSVLPKYLEERLFPPGSKITLKNSRVRAIKVRGNISPGLIFSLDIVKDKLGNQYAMGDNVSELLGIVKYEMPIWDLPKHMTTGPIGKRKFDNKEFKQYTDIENFKFYNRLFQTGEEVYLSTKCHGTSFRAGWFKTEVNSFWKKILLKMGWLPEYEFCWGSRKVQIQNKWVHTGYYDEDVYSKMVKQYDLKNRIPKGYAVYGEIVGPGIQANYTYDVPNGEHKLYVYDVLTEGKWLDYSVFQAKVAEMGLTPVPLCYVGPYDEQKVMSYLTVNPLHKQEINEGCVLKPVIETTCSMGRKVLKLINPVYYVQDTTEFH